MFLLAMSIVLFALSAFFYFYQSTSQAVTFSASLSYPYRAYGITLVGFGSALMLTASISYSKRSKNLGQTHRRHQRV
jgi:hypothetical protein